MASSRVIRGLAVVGVALSLVACSAAAGSSDVGRTSSTMTPSPSRRSTSRRAICSHRSTGRPSNAAAIRVHFVSRLGPREFVDPALQRGLVELVPEYAGTALQFASLGRVRPTAGTAANHRRLVDRLAGSPVVALAPSPAQDSNVIVTTREVAARHRLRTDQRPAPTSHPGSCSVDHRSARSGRSACRACERTYGLHFGRVLALDAGGPLTHQVLAAGEADVALLFSTDSQITDEGLVVLRDDRHLQPAENITPLIRRELVDRWGDDLTDLIDGVSRQLTTEELRRLNGELTDAPGSAADDRRAMVGEGACPMTGSTTVDPPAGAGRPRPLPPPPPPPRTSTPADAGAARPAPRRRCPGRSGAPVASGWPCSWSWRSGSAPHCSSLRSGRSPTSSTPRSSGCWPTCARRCSPTWPEGSIGSGPAGPSPCSGSA